MVNGYSNCYLRSPLSCTFYSEAGPESNISPLFPVIRSNLHPVHPHEFQPMLLGKLNRLERPSLGELLTADILRLEVQAMQDWLPEENEKVSVRF